MQDVRRLVGRLAVTLAAGWVSAPAVADAGGFDVPDVGTEALGRGGAFVAKADSGLAFYYNVAGLARQRGTRLLLDVNLVFHNAQFTREGKYPGTPCAELTPLSMERATCDQNTPWAGLAYPTVGNRQGFGYQPFLALSTDFGFFERWTFGVAVFSPPGIGTRQYGYRRELTVRDKTGAEQQTIRYEVDLPGPGGASWNTPGGPARAPSPARYDTAETSFTILTPSLAVAWNAWRRRLDLGLAVQWVVGQFDLVKANISPLGATSCGPTKDHPNCDSYGNIKTNSMSPGFILSLLAHPTSFLDAGLTYRPQVNVDSSGWVYPSPVIASGSKLAPFPATFSIKLPHIVRAGVRAVSRFPDGTERLDIELDATWENWSVQDYARVRSDQFDLGPGREDCPKLGPTPKGCLFIDSPQRFRDTFSLRLGGAYNLRLSDTSRLAVRFGTYYDSPSTKNEDTNLASFSTEKVAFTAGLGYRRRGFYVNLAYAAVWMPDRIVTGSQSVRAGSATNGTNWVNDVDPEIYVNNGRYQFTIHTFSLGAGVNFDEVRSGVLQAN